MKKTRSYIISFAVLVILWELLAVSGLFPESLFPSPVRTAEALGRRIASGALLLDIGASMYRFFIGYITSVIAAVVLGLLLGWFAGAWRYVDPVVQFLRPISPVAWLPFIVLWVGIGDVPAIVIIFIAAFFPVLLTTVTAVGNIDPVYLKISDNFGLGRAQTLLGIVFPAIFPQIANALHIAAGTAWIFLVVGSRISHHGRPQQPADRYADGSHHRHRHHRYRAGSADPPCTAACGTHLGIQQERRKIASDQRSMP